MENFIQITVDRIKKDEPCRGLFFDHDLKGKCIGYAFQGDVNPIDGSQIPEPITLDLATELLKFSLYEVDKELVYGIGYNYIHMDEYRKSFLLNMGDLIGVNNVFVRLKSSINAILNGEFEHAAELVLKNYTYREFFCNNRRFRNCVDAMQYGERFN